MLLLALVACEDTVSTCEDAATVEPRVELGVGELDFEDVAEGDLVDAVRGPQGGFHVWGAVRTEGFDPGHDALLGRYDEGPEVRFEFLVDDFVAAEGGAFRPFEGDVYDATLVGEPVYVDAWSLWDDWEEPQDVLGLFTVTVEDACGTTGSAEREVALSIW